MIYLDNHSTTQLDSRVFDAMKPWMLDDYGNASSTHIAGQKAYDAIEHAKEQVAEAINADPNQIYFTSSATEANNIALSGWMSKNPNSSIITSPIEHPSVLEPCRAINRTRPVVYVAVGSDGRLDYGRLEDVLSGYRSYTALVSLQAANNEIGTVNDLYCIGDLCKRYGAVFHSDASQAIGKVEIDVRDMGVFALTLSGHKIYGAKGVGALYVRDVDAFEPVLLGGYQGVLTSGTQNTAAIVGLGKAVELLMGEEQAEENRRIEGLRDYLLAWLLALFPGLVVNGTMESRLCNNLNVSIPNIPAEVMIRRLSALGICVSGGSACSAGVIGRSYVIEALGGQYQSNALRFGLGRFNTKEEIEQTLAAMKEIGEEVNGLDYK